MKIVIKIPDGCYKELCDATFPVQDAYRLVAWIVNGTPLPKGHGDLKDMEDIYKALEGWDDDTGWIVDAIDFQTPTIIEADKAESEV